MPSDKRLVLHTAAAALLTTMLTTNVDAADAVGTLAAPESFAAIGDAAARSAALFTEAGKVFMHPRCVNCHPVGDRPRQGERGQLHQPPVERGKDGFGLPAMRCSSCHQDVNFEPVRVPGALEWRLAPRGFAFEGSTVGQVCGRIKDPARNGGRSLQQILDHILTDPLIAWAWAPGSGRQPAPGTLQQMGALIAAWIKDGAACPGQ